MRRPITITTLLIAGIVGFTETNAQTTPQTTAKQHKGKKAAEYNKLRPDEKMPDAFYTSAEFNAFYTTHQHLSEADYQNAFNNLLHPISKDRKPVFVDTGNPEQDQLTYQREKKEWLKKNSPFDYWKESRSNTGEKRK